MLCVCVRVVHIKLFIKIHKLILVESINRTNSVKKEMNQNEQWPQEDGQGYEQPSMYVNQGNIMTDGYNENVPINDTQYADYTSGQPIAVESIAEPITKRELTHLTGERDDHWQFIKRHLHQLKYLSAGNLKTYS